MDWEGLISVVVCIAASIRGGGVGARLTWAPASDLEGGFTKQASPWPAVSHSLRSFLIPSIWPWSNRSDTLTPSNIWEPSLYPTFLPSSKARFQKSLRLAPSWVEAAASQNCSMSLTPAIHINVAKSMVVDDGGSENVVVGCRLLGTAAIGVVVVVAVVVSAVGADTADVAGGG